MLLSIVIPAYNVIPTLERSVDSVIKQNISDYEIILVNDGSTDETPQLCDQIAAKYDVVKVIHKDNGGLSSARNTGIQHARGKYIAFLDSDDEYVKGILPRFIDVQRRHDMDVYFFNLLRVKGNTSEKRNSVNKVTTNNVEALETVFTNNGADFYAWNKIWRSTLFEDISFPVGKIYEDIYTTYQCVKKAKKIVFDDYVGILYYENDDSITAQKFNERQYDNVTERIRLLDSIIEDFPTLTPYAARKLYDGLLDVAYRVSKHKDEKEAKYFESKLKRNYQEYREYFKNNNQISTIKDWAWRLYLISPKLYSITYDLYLN